MNNLRERLAVALLNLWEGGEPVSEHGYTLEGLRIFLAEKHDGDCTRQPYTCNHCVADIHLAYADKIIAHLEIDRLHSALATARREGIEDAAKWHDEREAVFRREHDRCMERWNIEKHPQRVVEALDASKAADRHHEYAAQIRALLSQSVEVGPTSSGNGGADAS